MAKAINSVICFQRIHEAARKEYLGENKKGDAFQIMLNAEQFFWKRSDCGLNDRYKHLHDWLVRNRKLAMQTLQERRALPDVSLVGCLTPERHRLRPVDSVGYNP